MSNILRILCIVCSVATFAFFCYKVRKEQIRVWDTVFWLAFSLCLILLGIFPQILIGVAELLGIISPVNGLFLAMLFIVLIKLFSQTVRISELNRKIERLSQEMALGRAERDADNINGEEKPHE